jgi:pyruvate formate lyase activating enzyme
VKTALIGDIGRYALHDGPGIRTTVFFKGCALRCPWCHNPEYIAAGAEIACYPSRCIGCGDCRDACPEGAVTVDTVARIDRTRCTGCGQCAAGCPAKALELVGREYEVGELIDILLRDRRFYETSDGGVTLSGGEATRQMECCGDLLERLKREGIHTAIETSGFFAWQAFKNICLPHLDLILVDLKIADPVRHLQVVGVDNGLILANLKQLLAGHAERVIVRIPLIPGYTADRQNLMRIGALLREYRAPRCSLLPYHPMGQGKAETVGRTADASLPQVPMDTETLARCRQFFDGIEIVDP